jgi:hypothetical protein
LDLLGLRVTTYVFPQKLGSVPLIYPASDDPVVVSYSHPPVLLVVNCFPKAPPNWLLTIGEGVRELQRIADAEPKLRLLRPRGTVPRVAEN